MFVAYAYAVATTVLLPLTLFNRRSRVVPPLSFSIISKIMLLGAIGSSSQLTGYAGIDYSSPTLASSIGNLVPAFTFMLAVTFRFAHESVGEGEDRHLILERCPDTSMNCRPLILVSDILWEYDEPQSLIASHQILRRKETSPMMVALITDGYN